MFGYVRIAKPELKIYEYELYRAVYCGSCELLGQYGYLARLALSYDMAFLLALEISVKNMDYTIKKRQCPFNPLKRVSEVIPAKETLSANIILELSKYKLLDTAVDSKALAIPARLGAGILKNMLDDTSAPFLEFAQVCTNTIKLQAQLEKSDETSIDAACEPTAQLMKKIFSMLSPNTDKAIEHLGYFMGRYVYICDALDDLYSDQKHSRYNVLLKQNLSTEKTIEKAVDSLRATIAEAYLALALINLNGQFASIVKNIVELGLLVTVEQISKRQLEKFNIDTV